MNARTAFRVILLLISLILLKAEIQALSGEGVSLERGWFPILLTLLAVATLLFRTRMEGSLVLSAFLASLSALSFEVFLTELPAPVPGTAQALPWMPFQILAPFVLVQLALVFPTRSVFYSKHPRLVRSLLYGTYFSVVVLSWIAQHSLMLLLLVFPLGFLLALGIFIYQYRYSLTPVERDRLQIVLIGCLAGAAPFFLAALRSPGDWMDTVGSILLPLFPLSLVTAVTTENIWAPRGVLRKALDITVLVSGFVSLFFLINLLLWWIFRSEDLRLAVISAGLCLALAFPLTRWSRVAVSAVFRDLWSSAGRTARPSVFKPIQPNPYIVGNPVRIRSMFFGRDEDFGFVR